MQRQMEIGAFGNSWSKEVRICLRGKIKKKNNLKMLHSLNPSWLVEIEGKKCFEKEIVIFIFGKNL